tara:strand:- start:440 stop:658 length:219 start_codon:yes stop_codon:yes gene_type:complete
MKQTTLNYIGQCAAERETGSITKLDCGDVRQLLNERGDLLTALQLVLSRQDWPVGTNKIRQAALVAIAKATA